MTANSSVWNSVAVADPSAPSHVIKPNADGSVNISGSIAASTSAVATAVAPTYTEGSTDPLSMTLGGALRIAGTISASSSEHSTASAPSYVEGTDNPLSGDLAGNLRVLAAQGGSWSVGINQGTPGVTNAVDATNFPVTADVNAGAAGASTIRVVLATGGATPLPTGAATQTTLAAVLSALGSPFQSGGSIANTTFASTQSGAWNITNITGTITLPTGAATSALQTSVGATAHTDSAAINTTLGSPFQAGGSIGNTSFGATQSGTWNVGLSAGANLIGKVGIDQTTPGTTNAVAVTNTSFPAVVRTAKGDAALTLTASVSETTLIAATTSVKHDLYGVIIENTSATATEVSFRDTTGGTIRFFIYIPAGDTRGFMLPADSGYNQTTANTNWTAQCGTSVSSIKISALYVNN